MIKNIATVSRLLLFAALVLFVTGGHPWSAATAFAPIPQILFGLFLLAMYFLRSPLERLIDGTDLIGDKLFIRGAILAAFALILTANRAVLDGVPHVTDSVAYLFQAKLIAEWRLTHPPLTLPEFFLPHFFFIDDDQRLISLFQPGWPAILSLGVRAGLPWIINPLIGAFTLLPAYNIIKRGFGRRTARLAIIILLASPFYIFMSASFMAHTLTGFLGLLAIDNALAYRNDYKWRRALIVGIAIGAMFTIRAYNACLMLIPLAVIAAPLVFERGARIRHLGLAVIAAMSIASLQLIANENLTGDCFTFPQDIYFAKTEKSPDCHRLGFGPDIGCNEEHGRQFSFPDGFGPREALAVTRQRLASLSLNLLGTPVALILIFLPFAGGRLGKEGLALSALLFSLAGGYFFFYYHGNCYGPRFYYEGVTAMGALVALGVIRLDGWLGRLAALRPEFKRLLKAVTPAVFLSMMVFSAAYLHPKLWKTYRGFRGIDGRMQTIIDKSGFKEGVILMPGDDANYAYGFNMAEPGFYGDIVFARHLFDQSAHLMYLYPEREFHRFEPRRNRIVKVRKLGFDGVIFIEMDSKLPPHRTRAGFARMTWIDMYRPENDDARQIYFEGEGLSSSFTIRQYIFESGEYHIECEAMRGPYLADWRLEVNGKPLGVDFIGYADGYHFRKWRSDETVRLERGQAEFTFVISGHDEKALAYGIGIDTMTLRRFPGAMKKPAPKIEDIGYFDKGRILPIPKKGGIPKLKLEKRKAKKKKP